MTSRGSSSRRPRFSHYIEYFFLLCAGVVLRAIPVCGHAAIGRFISRFWYYVFPFRKSVVLGNLAIAFPEKSDAWRREVARRSVAHFVVMALEFQRMQREGTEAIEKKVDPKIEGIEYFKAAGGGVSPTIFVTGHLGNWELFVSYFTATLKIKIAVLAKPLHNPLVENVVARTRSARGYEVIYTRGDLRSIIRTVHQGRSLAFLADQDARRSGLFVPFFSRHASTFQGPALFACRLNLPMVVCTCCRSEEGGPYHVRFYPPLLSDPENDRESEIERLTKAHVAILESAIREHPEQYFWFHKRWKSIPKKSHIGSTKE